MSAPLALPRRLASDRAGTAAVEFALLFPLMLALFIGTYEVENVLMADLKVTAAAETAADLVAQTSATYGALQASDFTNFTSATAAVLSPLPVGTSNSLVKIAYASVSV